jgi:catechol 1,2-dioxygenase
MSDNDRLAVAFERTLRAMRDVVRETKLTEDEIHRAAEFLNRVGQAGEFPLLFDITVAVTSVEANHGTDAGTRANIEGPYYRPGAPERPGGRLAVRAPSSDAVALTVSGRVTEAATGHPVAGAEIDVWQADEHGEYDYSDDFHLRGVVRTDDAGGYRFETVVPAPYTIPPGGPVGELMAALHRSIYRPAHIHFRVRTGGRQRLMSQFFIAGGRYLDSDVAEAVSSDLVVPMRRQEPADGTEAYQLTFDIALPTPTPAYATP